MISAGLLEILCCPETRQKLAVADEKLIQRLNARIAAGQMRNRAGEPVTEKLKGGLLRQDGKWLYPVRRDIPVLLIDEALPVAIPPANRASK